MLMSRLQRFRNFVAKMDPTADPAWALERGFYVPPPVDLAHSVATRFELEPASTHLIVGVVGSGKTTIALKVAERLQLTTRKVGDQVKFLDVSTRHLMDHEPLRGVLAALAGLDLTKSAEKRGKLPKEASEAALAIRRHARGYTEWVPDYEGPPDYDEPPDEPPERPIHHPGVLKAPTNSSLPRDVSLLIESLRILAQHYPGPRAHAIYLFDSLDRLASPTRFVEAVGDVRALKQAGIGAMVIGPVRYAPSFDPTIQSVFEHIHFVGVVDPDTPSGSQFYGEVLRRRAHSTVLPDNMLSPIATASGGILRDLLGIARRAGEEAYVDGRDRIEQADVDVATRILGESLAFGLDAAQLAVLRHLDAGKGFVIRGAGELALIEQRRVIASGPGVWRVHPALRPVLAGIPEVAT